MAFGFWQRILRVNLTTRRTSVETPDETFYRRYFGGAGFTAYYLLSELPPMVQPLGAGNLLVFAAGVCTGAPIAGCGRNGVGALSPMTGGFGKCEVGGFWGAELKRAGYDGIVVEGRADAPVYLWINDDEVQVRDARHLWGLGTLASQEAIRRELGDERVRTAQIGPGGENLIRYACIINDLRGSAGRGGLGAVMGSKNLKAIAVRGHRQVPLADPEKARDLARWVAAHVMTLARGSHDLGTGAVMPAYAATGNLPTRNFRDGYFPESRRIDAEAVRDTIRIGMGGCFACPIRCKKIVRVDAPYLADPAFGGPEYETLAAFGSNCGVDDLKAIAHGHHLCQEYSIDTISTGATIAFAMECFENGLLSLGDTDGLELRFGNASAMIEMIHRIAHRRGLGDMLAEGTARAARQIGGGAEQFAMEVKGLELGMHEPRLKRGLGFGYAVASHGADHGVGLQDHFYEKPGPAMEAIKALGVLEPVPVDELSPRKVQLFLYLQQWRAIQDSLVVCYFVPFSFQQTAEMVSAVTGWNTTVWELMKVGERVITMARALNVREGFTPADDRLPERFFQPPLLGPLREKGWAVNREELERAKRDYYQMLGWDVATGIPCRAKLEELGVGWVADGLHKVGVEVT